MRHQHSAVFMKERGTKNLSAIKVVGPRLFSLAWGERKILSLGLIALFLASGTNLFFPWLIRGVLDGTLGLSIERDLSKVFIILVVLFAFQACFFYLRHYCFSVAGFRVVSSIRNRLFNKLLHQDIAFFDRSRSGDLLSRLSSDTQALQTAVTTNVSIALRHSLQVIGSFVLMLAISPKLTLIIVILIPVIIAAGRTWGKNLSAVSKTMQSELGEASVVAEEALGSIRTVRTFNAESVESSRYESKISKALECGVKRSKVAALFSSSMVFLIHTGIAVVLWVGSTLVLSNQLSTGDLTAFVLYCVIGAVSFSLLLGAFDDFLHAVGAGERVFEIIDAVPTVVSPKEPKGIESLNGASPLIEFDSVSFAYPTRPQTEILHNISFSIPAGSTVAIVGPSGAGKSTIASLIPRLYEVSAGTIKFKGVPINELELSQLRDRISVVSQDSEVFSISIRENIRYGKPTATEEEIVAAAQSASLLSFIQSLPEGFDTPIGDRGLQLSGGQRQRLTIARAILKNPQLLILDEATSALDSENELIVREALKVLMKGRTTLIIAHRLSTIQHADEVLVLKDGNIIQRGNHQILISTDGLYKSLVEHQLL